MRCSRATHKRGSPTSAANLIRVGVRVRVRDRVSLRLRDRVRVRVRVTRAPRARSCR